MAVTVVVIDVACFTCAGGFTGGPEVTLAAANLSAVFLVSTPFFANLSVRVAAALL